METIKKLYHYYMLVAVDFDANGDEVIVTGEALKERLEGMGFTAPTMFNFVELKRYSSDINGDGHVSNEEMTIAEVMNKPIDEENARMREEYFKQFTDFADFLRTGSGLQLARLAKVKLANGRSVNKYLLNTPLSYGFQQVAERIMGKYTKGKLWAVRSGKWVKITPIEFIAFERFG